MRRIVRPGQDTTPDIPAPVDLSGTEFDIEKLLANSGEILRREIANLLGESSRGKLNGASARDLVAYIRLLQELKSAQIDELSQLTNEELEAKISKGGKA